MKTSLVIGVCAAYERARWSFWDMPAAIVASTYLSHLAHDGATVAFIPPKPRSTALSAWSAPSTGYCCSVEPTLIRRCTGRLPVSCSRRRSRFATGARSRWYARQWPKAYRCSVPRAPCHERRDRRHSARHRCAGRCAAQEGAGATRRAYLHEADVAANSFVADALGAGLTTVNSHHHQAVKRVGSGGRVTAVSPEDGVVEAVEWSERGFALGVQWHPEAADIDGLFRVFLDECRARVSREANVSNQHQQATEKEPANGNA